MGLFRKCQTLETDTASERKRDFFSSYSPNPGVMILLYEEGLSMILSSGAMHMQMHSLSRRSAGWIRCRPQGLLSLQQLACISFYNSLLPSVTPSSPALSLPEQDMI